MSRFHATVSSVFEQTFQSNQRSTFLFTLLMEERFGFDVCRLIGSEKDGVRVFWCKFKVESCWSCAREVVFVTYSLDDVIHDSNLTDCGHTGFLVVVSSSPSLPSTFALS